MRSHCQRIEVTSGVFSNFVREVRGICIEKRFDVRPGWRARVIHSDNNYAATGVGKRENIFDRLAERTAVGRIERLLELHLLRFSRRGQASWILSMALGGLATELN